MCNRADWLTNDGLSVASLGFVFDQRLSNFSVSTPYRARYNPERIAMSLSLYDVSIPAFLRGFANLSAIIEKGRAYADEQGIAHEELLQARLIADMAPLTAQIQRCSDTAKGVAVRIGQVDNVAMPDTETSFDELQARIAATVAFLEAVPAESFDGREAATVTVKTAAGETSLAGLDFVLGFALPNFFFHVTTAYDLLRMKGVPLGKLDYLGRPQ
jgi:hypothetical protein